MRAALALAVARGRGARGLGRVGALADRTGVDAGEAVRASRLAGPRRDDGDLAQRRHDDAHGHRGRRRVRLGFRASGRDLPGDVRGAGDLRLPLHDPSVHAGHRAACSEWCSAGPRSLLPAGRRARLEGVAPAGVTEVVLERVSPGPREVVARATPGTDGAFGFTVRAPEPRGYRVRAGSASSPTVRVRVTPHVQIARRGDGLVVSARPARAGSRVAIQMYERERFAFVTVARGRLDASSRAAIRYVPERRAHVRAVVRGSQGWSDGFSRPVVVLPR